MLARLLRALLFLFMMLALPLSRVPLSAHSQSVEPVTISFQEGVAPTADYTGTRDTYLSEPAPTTNYAVPTTLVLDGDAPDDADYARDEMAALLAWDIQSIPPGSRVTQVEVKLNVNYRNTGTWQVYGMFHPWSETEATWLRAASGQPWHFPGAQSSWDRGSTPVGSLSTSTTSSTVTLNEQGIELVQRWVNDPSCNHGLIIAKSISSLRTSVSSSESSSLAARPRLTITYQPPPELNTPPSADALAPTANEDIPLPLALTGSDPDGDPLVYRIATLPEHGQLVLAGDQVIYRPNLHYNGADSFSYAVSDGRMESEPAAVSIMVLPVNDAPAPVLSANTWEGSAPLAVQLTASASDLEDSTGITFQWDIAGLAAAAGSQAEYTFTGPGFYPVTLTAADAAGGSSQVTRTVVVHDPNATARTNVILFVGDGMGINQVRAASMFGYGREGALRFEGFPYQALMKTRSANSSTTDSAAAASAMATGVKVNNAVISQAIPGDGRDLYTVLESARDHGQSTGLVTTNNITDATPAGFGAHTPDRENEAEIAADYLTQTRPNVLFGAGDFGMTHQAALDAGYQLVTNLAEMQALDTEAAAFVSGQFGDKPLPYEFDWSGSQPHLADMTETALNILDNDPDGFFLLVEDENTDRAAHLYDIRKVVHDVLELERAVDRAVAWARTHPNTLIVVLADHETSGYQLLADRGLGNYPDSAWTVLNHTGQDVKVYALGSGAWRVNGTIDNTQIATILAGGAFNHPPVVSTNAIQTATIEMPVNLSASVSDDNLPAAGALQYTWSLVEGPGAVDVANPNAPQTQAVFHALGDYKFDFTASDGDLSTEVMITVTVQERVNLAPKVTLAVDQTVYLGDGILLSASVTDDDFPNPLTFQWTQVSGPGTVNFASPTASATQAAFTLPGRYVLRFEASDGDKVGSAAVTITVLDRFFLPAVLAPNPQP